MDQDSATRSGVTEVKGNYGEALRIIGTQDAVGNHIGIVNISWVGLRLVGLALRIVGLIAVIALFAVQQPLSWLPVPDTAPAALVALRDWQVVSLGTWLAALVLYLLYFAIAQFKSSVFVGQSGAEIHLARHKKIVDTVRAGELRVVLDPRVYLLAVVSTKYFRLPAAQVDATTKDNIRCFVGVNESEILTYVPDRRSISGLAAMMLGFFFLPVLPPGVKLLSILFFLAGTAYFLVGYVVNAKISECLGLSDVPGTVRYQLLHRTASAVLAARQFCADAAVMLVHEQGDSWPHTPHT